MEPTPSSARDLAGTSPLRSRDRLRVVQVRATRSSDASGLDAVGASITSAFDFGRLNSFIDATEGIAPRVAANCRRSELALSGSRWGTGRPVDWMRLRVDVAGGGLVDVRVMAVSWVSLSDTLALLEDLYYEDLIGEPASWDSQALDDPGAAPDRVEPMHQVVLLPDSHDEPDWALWQRLIYRFDDDARREFTSITQPAELNRRHGQVAAVGTYGTVLWRIQNDVEQGIIASAALNVSAVSSLQRTRALAHTTLKDLHRQAIESDNSYLTPGLRRELRREVGRDSGDPELPRCRADFRRRGLGHYRSPLAEPAYRVLPPGPLPRSQHPRTSRRRRPHARPPPIRRRRRTRHPPKRRNHRQRTPSPTLVHRRPNPRRDHHPPLTATGVLQHDVPEDQSSGWTVPQRTPAVSPDGKIFVNDLEGGLHRMSTSANGPSLDHLFHALSTDGRRIPTHEVVISDSLAVFIGPDYRSIHDLKSGQLIHFERFARIQGVHLTAPNRLLYSCGSGIEAENLVRGLYEIEFEPGAARLVWRDEDLDAKAFTVGDPVCFDANEAHDLILIGTEFGVVRASRLSTRHELWSIHTSDLVRVVRAVRDGVVLGHNSGRISMLDPNTGEQRWSQPIHPSGVSGIAEDPSGDLLATTSSTGLLRLINHQGNVVLGTVLPPLAITPVWADDETLLVASRRGVHQMRITLG